MSGPRLLLLASLFAGAPACGASGPPADVALVPTSTPTASAAPSASAPPVRRAWPIDRAPDGQELDVLAGRVPELAPVLERLASGDEQGALARLEALRLTGAPVQMQLLASGLLGRVAYRLGRDDAAERAYRRVVDLYAEHANALGAEAALGDAGLRQLGVALVVVGEARFFQAERLRSGASAPPSPDGVRTRADTQRYLNDAFRGWLVTRKRTLEEAEQAYKKVLELEPVPPPRWVVASAHQVGAMWAELAEAIRAVPVPDEWKGEGDVRGVDGLSRAELRRVFQEGLADVTSPLVARARQAYAHCEAAAVKYAYPGTLADACKAWLAAHPAASP